MHRSFARVTILALALGIAVGCGSDGATYQPRQPQLYSIDDFMEVTNYSGASFSPDMSKLLVTSDVTGISNAFSIPIEGGEPTQLTFSESDSVRSARYFPHDERLLYIADQGGNERFHVYVRELDGTLRDLTPGEGDHRATFAGWSHDGESFFVSSNERDARFPDIYRYATDGYERELIFENNEGLSLAAASNDGRYLALQKTTTRAKVDVYLYDRETAELKNITETSDDVVNRAMDFLPDGSALLIASDADAEFTYLEKYDMETGQRETVLQPDWDVVGASFSHGGKYLVVWINNDARTEIRVIETATNRLVELPRFKAADIPSVVVSRDETTIAFYMSRSKNPRDLFVHTIGESGQPTQLTRSLNPKIEPDDLVEGKVVRFDSYDGLEIPGILYRPHAASGDDRAPALVWVHGGPGGQSRIGYSNLIQYLVNHGYVVYAINNRGSSGYGKSFFAADDRQHGEADLGDCIASKKMLIDTGYVDPERIGIIGGSYGGYMVLAAMAFEPEAFRVGVDIFGVANWERTLLSIPKWWEAQREALYAEMGDPTEDLERLKRISPLFHADRIARPLLVLQGANDPRVLKVESDEMVAAARENGATVEYVVFEDEGHGFAKKENQREGYSKIRAFLDEHLKGEAPVYDEAEGEASGNALIGRKSRDFRRCGPPVCWGRPIPGGQGRAFAVNLISGPERPSRSRVMKRAFGLIVGICLLGAAAVAAEPIELAAGDRERLDKAMSALTVKLSLDERQIESFRPLLAVHYRELGEIRDVYSRWPAEEGQPAFLQEREELREALYQKLGSVLDPTQLDRFRRLQAANVNHAAAAREPE